jgi:hypothetical protein
MDTKDAERLGGQARAKRNDLSEINRKAAKKRWAKRKKRTGR